MREHHRLRRLINAFGLAAAITTAVSVPLGYALVSYDGEAAELELRARITAGRLSKYAYGQERVWHFHEGRLSDLVRMPEAEPTLTRQRVLGADGAVFLDQGASLPSPVMRRSAPIVLAGTTIGEAQIEASLRPLLGAAGIATLVGLLFGFGIWVVMRVLPLRALDRTSVVLEAEKIALRRRDAQLSAALQNMGQGLCMFDGDARLVVHNARFHELLGLDPAAAPIGTSHRAIVEALLRSGQYQGITVDEAVERTRSRIAAGDSTQVLRELADGRIIAVVHQTMPEGGWVATFEDVSEERRREAQISHLAHHDALTDLANRVLFRLRLQTAFAQMKAAEPATPVSFAVLAVDLDGFKSVNDTLGHAVGDALLVEVARRLSRAGERESGLAARLGGDEFALMLPAIADREGACERALALVETLAEPYTFDGHCLLIGASVGVAFAPSDGADPETLMKSADIALYRAKADGRGTVRSFEPELEARMQRRRALEQDLRAAFAESRFELHYQPLVEVSTGEIAAFEALLRWHRGEGGALSPADFIPLAEEIGLIVPLGQWVLRQACRDAARWPSTIRVAVNLSAVQFRGGDLLTTVRDALEAAGLAPNRLELEITESVLLVDNEATLATLHQLRALGVRIAMDDFGTGYSSLGYLRAFPFDKIKIDRSFVRDMATSDESRAIVRAILSLTATLGVTTTAEGVETPEQLERLREEGCTEVQGYLFSPARPALDTMLLLAKAPWPQLSADLDPAKAAKSA